MSKPISQRSLTDEIWKAVEIMRPLKHSFPSNPAADLIALKQICKELQKELAYAVPDHDAVARLAEDARYLADCIKHWAIEQ